MQHVTFADKSLLIGDAAARVLLSYAASLGSRDLADTVTLNAISSDGDEVEAIFLLNSGSPLMSESATTSVVEPENEKAVGYMLDRIQLLESPPNVVGERANNSIDFDEP